MLSRRQLIFGAFRATGPAELPSAAQPSDAFAPKIISFAAHCLALQNVVCRTCGERCETDAIRFTPRLGAAAEPVLLTDRCTGCGDCVPVCPNAALHLIAAAPLNPTVEEFAA